MNTHLLPTHINKVKLLS